MGRDREEGGGARKQEIAVKPNRNVRGAWRGLPRLMAEAFNPISPEWKFILSLSPRLSKFPSSLLTREKGSKEDGTDDVSRLFPNPTPAPAL